MTTAAWGVRGYRLVFGVLSLVAVVAQLVHTGRSGNLNPVNFFSYFTILANLLGATVLLYGAVRAPGPSRSYESVRGASTLYLALTGVVFALLLSSIEVGQPLPWVNFTHHKLMPVVVVVDWLLVAPQVRLGLRDAALWLVGPLVYLGYTLLRGPAAKWYPYPFLDAGLHGYGKVLGTCAVIAVGVALAAPIVQWAGNTLGARRGNFASADEPA